MGKFARAHGLYSRDAAALGRGEGSTIGARVRSTFFGLGMEKFLPTWPDLSVGAARLSASWAAVERSPGTFTWVDLDSRVSTVESHGAKPLLTLVSTPRTHATGALPLTSASPPDLGAYREFVRALVGRYGNRVDYQVWNEPNVPIFYSGRPAHMARMTRIFGRTVHQIAPGATVVAPSFPLRIKSNRTWFREYWTQQLGKKGVGDFVDVASLSAYPMPLGDPENGLEITQWAQRTVAQAGFDLPIWATEINYGANGGAPTAPIPMNTQVSNVVRTYVLHATAGTGRVYWYSWSPDGTVNTQLQDGHGALTRAGDAYEVVREWLLGTRPRGCTSTRLVTTCGFRVDRETTRFISWTPSGRIRTVVAPRGARTRTDPAGRSNRIKSGQELHVGLKPVMIEVRRAR